MVSCKFGLHHHHAHFVSLNKGAQKKESSFLDETRSAMYVEEDHAFAPGKALSIDLIR
jgi:hypothetical protein